MKLKLFLLYIPSMIPSSPTVLIMPTPVAVGLEEESQVWTSLTFPHHNFFLAIMAEFPKVGLRSSGIRAFSVRTSKGRGESLNTRARETPHKLLMATRHFNLHQGQAPRRERAVEDNRGQRTLNSLKVSARFLVWTSRLRKLFIIRRCVE